MFSCIGNYNLINYLFIQSTTTITRNDALLPFVYISPKRNNKLCIINLNVVHSMMKEWRAKCIMMRNIGTQVARGERGLALTFTPSRCCLQEVASRRCALLHERVEYQINVCVAVWG